MSNILSRIQEIALNEGITIGALERRIGASKGVLSRAISNGTDIQSKWIQTIVENYPSYSTRWLLTGQGSMLRNEHQTQSEQSTMHQNLPGEAAAYYRLYEKKDAEVGQLKEEIGVLKNKLSQYESPPLKPIEEHLHEGLDSAKIATSKKTSSPPTDNATSATAP